jgi:hypothetical protein
MLGEDELAVLRLADDADEVVAILRAHAGGRHEEDAAGG